MSPLRLEFLAVTRLGEPLDIQIGPVDDAPAAPRAHELIVLGGERWEVVDVRWVLPEGLGPMIAVLSVQRRPPAPGTVP